MINPKEKLVNMWMLGMISSDDLVGEMNYHQRMCAMKNDR